MGIKRGVETIAKQNIKKAKTGSDATGIAGTDHEVKTVQTEESSVITLPSPKLQGSELSDSTGKLPIHPKKGPNPRTASCRMCPSQHIYTVEGECLSICHNCGAMANYEEVLCSGKSRGPSCNSCAGVDDIKRVTTGSQVSMKGSSAVANNVNFKMGKEEKEEEFLRNLIYEFSENLSLSMRATHHAFSIAKGFLKELQPGRKRGMNCRKMQSRESALLELASACLLISCRHFKSGVTLKQIEKETDVHKTCIISKKRQIEAVTGIMEIVQENDLQGILTRACSVLKLPLEQISAVQTTAEGTIRFNLSQRLQPATVVAGCIYLVVRVADGSSSRSEICGITCVSWHSIRKLYRKLLPHAEKLLPDNFRNTFADHIGVLRMFEFPRMGKMSRDRN